MKIPHSPRSITTDRRRQVPEVPTSKSPRPGSVQIGGELSYTSCCNQATVRYSYTFQQNRRFHSLLSTLHSLLAFGRSGLRPSLVRGDSPRNAPHRMPDRRGQLERLRLRLVFELPRHHCRGRPCACKMPPKKRTANDSSHRCHESPT